MEAKMVNLQSIIDKQVKYTDTLKKELAEAIKACGYSPAELKDEKKAAKVLNQLFEELARKNGWTGDETEVLNKQLTSLGISLPSLASWVQRFGTLSEQVIDRAVSSEFTEAALTQGTYKYRVFDSKEEAEKKIEEMTKEFLKFGINYKPGKLDTPIEVEKDLKALYSQMVELGVSNPKYKFS